MQTNGSNYVVIYALEARDGGKRSILAKKGQDEKGGNYEINKSIQDTNENVEQSCFITFK